MDYRRREAIAAEVRAEMARQRLTQQALATGTGIKLLRLQSRLSARTAFAVEELVAVAAYFGISATELVDRADVAVTHR